MMNRFWVTGLLGIVVLTPAAAHGQAGGKKSAATTRVLEAEARSLRSGRAEPVSG